MCLNSILLQFAMYVASDAEEGLYNLYFHSCPNYEPNKQVSLDFKVCINYCLITKLIQNMILSYYIKFYHIT